MFFIRQRLVTVTDYSTFFTCFFVIISDYSFIIGFSNSGLTESGYCVNVYMFEKVKHCTTKQSIHSHLAVIVLASVYKFSSEMNFLFMKTCG